MQDLQRRIAEYVVHWRTFSIDRTRHRARQVRDVCVATFKKQLSRTNIDHFWASFRRLATRCHSRSQESWPVVIKRLEQLVQQASARGRDLYALASGKLAETHHHQDFAASIKSSITSLKTAASRLNKFHGLLVLLFFSPTMLLFVKQVVEQSPDRSQRVSSIVREKPRDLGPSGVQVTPAKTVDSKQVEPDLVVESIEPAVAEIAVAKIVAVVPKPRKQLAVPADQPSEWIPTEALYKTVAERDDFDPLGLPLDTDVQAESVQPDDESEDPMETDAPLIPLDATTVDQSERPTRMPSTGIDRNSRQNTGQDEIVRDAIQVNPFQANDGMVPNDGLSDPNPQKVDIWGSFDTASLNDRVTNDLLGLDDKQSMALADAVQSAIWNAPEIKVLRIENQIVDQQIAIEESAVDWNSFVSSTWDRANSPVGSALDGANDRLIRSDLEYQAGLSRQDWNGGTFSMTQDVGLSDSNSQFFSPSNQSAARVGIEYRQPLMQGSGRQVNRSRVLLAIKNSETTRQDYIRGLQNHIWGVIQSYWSLSQSRGALVVEQDLYAMTKATMQIVKNRSRIDVNPLLLARCKASLARRSAALQAAQYDVVIRQDDLLRRIYGNAFVDKPPFEIITATTMISEPIDTNAQNQLSIAMTNRPEIRRDLISLQQAAIEEGVAKNRLLPTLNAFGSLAYRGLDGSYDVYQSLIDQFTFDDPSLSAGLEYRFPIGNRAARAAHRQAKLRISSLQQQLAVTMSEVGLEVRTTINRYNQNLDQVHSLADANALAEQEISILIDRTRILLDGDQMGAFYVDTLLSAQDRLASTQRDLWAAQVGKEIAALEVQRVNGTLCREVCE